MSAHALPAAILRWLVVGLWTASAISQLHAEWRDWRTRAPASHPEMPAEEQGRAEAVLIECARRVGAGDLLIVSGGDDAIEVFLRYRLAYELYPARVVDAPGTPDAMQAALLQPGRFRERYALVLGRPDLEIPDTREASLSPKDRLLEAIEPGR